MYNFRLYNGKLYTEREFSKIQNPTEQFDSLPSAYDNMRVENGLMSIDGMNTKTLNLFTRRMNNLISKIDGKLTDKITTYYNNGTVKSVQLVQAGKLGKKTKTTDLKKFSVEKVYQDEYPPKITNPKTKGVRFIPSGYNTIYNDNDEIWQDGDFKDGQLYDGKVYIYGNNGLLLKVKVFKGGKFHSLGQL